MFKSDKKVEQAVTCPHGCGRSVLPSRLASHYLWAAAEHVLAEFTQVPYLAAYAQLSAYSQANPSESAGA